MVSVMQYFPEIIPGSPKNVPSPAIGRKRKRGEAARDSAAYAAAADSQIRRLQIPD